MKVSLAVQVYNGGAYWRQCWESIVANLDIFDNVFVSISNSPKQKEDIALVESLSSPKIHLLVHNDPFLSSVEHGKRLDFWLSSFDLEGHIFFFCHDDLLLREGLLELKNLEVTDEDAVFGPWLFFDDDGVKHPLTVRQFRRDDGRPLSSQEFGFLIDQQLYAINISGTVVPGSTITRQEFPWHLCTYGCRSEYLHVCNPQIKRVYQLAAPAVKIRQHSNSEGSLMPAHKNRFDTILYLTRAFEVYSDSATREFTTQSFSYILRKAPLKGLASLLRAEWVLLRSGYISAGTACRLWGALFSSLTGKIFRRIAFAVRRKRG